MYLVDLTFLFCLKYPAGLIRTLCAYENSQDPKSLCKTLTWKKKSNSLNHYIRLTGKWISPCQLPLEKGCLWSCRIKKSSITWWKYTYIWKWQSKNNSLFFFGVLLISPFRSLWSSWLCCQRLSVPMSIIKIPYVCVNHRHELVVQIIT